MKEDVEGRRVVAACADMLFAARIRGTAQQAGAVVELVGSAAALHAAAAGADLVLLDLGARWLRAGEAIRRLKREAATAGVPVVAFVSHVDAGAIGEARDAGADAVLARSAFVRQLPVLLRGGPVRGAGAG
jgi:CheY-like chemotaxis protein